MMAFMIALFAFSCDESNEETDGMEMIINKSAEVIDGDYQCLSKKK